MNIKKVVAIVLIIAIAIIAIIGIMFIGGKSNKTSGIEMYTARTNEEFENALIENYKEMRKFVREIGLETVVKDYESFNATETFNEDYFTNKKVAVIGIYEDNAAVYEYHIDDVKYNDDKTIATLEYTNKNSGYSGTLSSSWINCMIIELESTVTNVNFIEITK